MRAFSHLRMPAPQIEIIPSRTLRGDPRYHAKIEAPSCTLCHDRHALLSHRKYLELYPLLPFECIHGEVIHDLAVDERADKEHVALPTTIDRHMPDYVSDSTAGSVCAAKAQRDLAFLLGKGRE